MVAQSFDLLLQTGIGAYLIDPGTPVGALSTGVVRLTYDLYSVSPNDPSFDPAKDLVSSGNFLDANASVQVQPQAAGTPEPSTCLLLGVRRAACGRGSPAAEIQNGLKKFHLAFSRSAVENWATSRQDLARSASNVILKREPVASA